MVESAGIEDVTRRLAGHALTVEARDGNWLVRGNTFERRWAMGRVGGTWSKSSQAWVYGAAADLARLADALDSPTATTGLAEGPAPAWGSRHYHGHRGRLRQRFADAGPDSLADYELLELILFFSVWRRDTKPMAKALLDRFGSLGGVLAAEPLRYGEIAELAHVPEQGEGEEGPSRANDLPFTQILLKAVQTMLQRVAREQILDRPVIGSWTGLIEYLTLAMAHETAEHFRLLFLDKKNILIKDEVQSRGTVDHTPLYPREVVKRALELAASAVILVHNHPSGDPTPSRADIDMTRQVAAALGAVGIEVHDHVIVGRNRHTSFRSQKLL